MLSNVIRFFTKSPRHRIVGDYRRSTNSKEECLAYLKKNYRKICKVHSFATFKEFTLNYRILFDRKNKNKIIQDYKKYILTKTKFHKSNVAMSFNLIQSINVDKELEKQIIDFMYAQLNDESINKFRNVEKINKVVIMEFVKKNLVTKEPK